jgi:TonB family protein
LRAARAADDPWVRLPWIGPIAVSLSFAALYGFLRLTLSHAPPPSVSRPVTVSIIELPAPATAQPRPSAPPQAAPPPEPTKTVEIAPPKPLLESLSRPKRPPPRPERPVRAKAPEAPRPPPAVTPSPAPAVIAPAPPSHSQSPAGANMSARAIYQPMPEIPEELRRRNIDLVAVARFRVGPDGKAAVELIQPTPEPTLNRALLERLQTWRFFPALANGAPVATVIDIRIPISVR